MPHNFSPAEEERARRRVCITRRVWRRLHAPSREPSRADLSIFCLLVSYMPLSNYRIEDG